MSDNNIDKLISYIKELELMLVGAHKELPAMREDVTDILDR